MKSAAIIASYPYYHYDRLGRIDCVFSQRGGAGAEHLIASYKYYPTGSVKTVTLGNSLSLTYTYHISGVVKSAKVVSANGGEYSYYGGTNKLKSVADNMGGSTSYRTMSANDNFAYDRDGNLVEDKSKQMKIAYNWRGMPIEFVRKTDSGDSLKLVMKYDGSGRRVSKTSMRKAGGEWDTLKVTHYTGIGTEIREEFADSAAGTKVVVPMPQGLGRYGIECASSPTGGDKAFEWYLKNHLGSTMLVYGTTGTASSPELKHAYDYRSFGEQIDLTKRNDKVTENFTGKEKDDETELNYFGARYLDPMLGLWISVDPARQFASPYLYVGNGVNPMNGFDSDGLLWEYAQNSGKLTYIDDKTGVRTLKAIGYAGKGLGKNNANWDNIRGGKNIPNSGPLPAGKYTFAPMIENYVTSRGVSLPFTMQLIPDPENEMFGRSGFLAHGDNSTHTASDGCLIFDRAMRKAIDESGDRALQVVPDAAEGMDPEWFGSGNVTVGDPIIEQE